MTRELALRIAIGAALVAACVSGFFACFEKREVWVETSVSPEVRRNNYLALARLLRGMGHEVQVHQDIAKLERLPEPPATVFLPVQRGGFGEKRSEALLDWVAGGGHLVVATYTVWGEPADGPEAEGEPGALRDVIVNGRPDSLLDRFGLRQRMWSEEERANATAEAAVKGLQLDEADAPEAGAEPDPGAEEDPPAPSPFPSVSDILSGDWQPGSVEPAWAYLESDEEPLEVEFHEGFWWEDTAGVVTWSVDGAAGPHLVEVAHGEGTLSALTSDEPFANRTIGRVQNAEFVVRWLRHGREEPAPVWIFYEAEWPSVLALLRRHALPALVAGAALLALWLWRGAFRFGPALPAPQLARRRWLEHLEAAGRFHWRQDRGGALLAALRADLVRAIERRHPGWMRLSERQRTERLATASGVDHGQVAHALLGSPRGTKGFTAAVRTLEHLRAAL